MLARLPQGVWFRTLLCELPPGQPGHPRGLRGGYLRYVERVHRRLNIISSDDNNKGKTIEIQSMMYALGNEPAFLTSFEYKDYYHYIEFEICGKTYQLCRYNNGFVPKNGSILMLFDNVSEFKRYWNKHITSLPRCIYGNTV